MTYSKEFIDWMSRRVMRRIELEIYTAIATPSFLAANPHLPSPVAVSTRDYGPRPEPYERVPHQCGPQCSRPFSIMDFV